MGSVATILNFYYLLLTSIFVDDLKKNAASNFVLFFCVAQTLDFLFESEGALPSQER